MKEKEEKKVALVQVRADVHEELKRYCNETGFKMSVLVSNIIRKYLKENK